MSVLNYQSRLADADAGPGSHRSHRRSGLAPKGYLWILPAFALCVGVIYYCVGYSIHISTLSWDGLSSHKQSVGLENYQRLLTDPLFWSALWHTLVFFIVVFAVQTSLGIVFAAMLHSKVKLAVVYKVLIFLPVVIAPAIMAPVHRNVLSQEGAVNWILSHLGLGSFTRSWLADTSTSLWSIVAVQIWSSVGVAFILFFAAMSQVDLDTLEAARIDGEGNIRALWHIVIPEVRGTIVALGILNAMAALRLFDFPYLLTRGGPVYSSEFPGVFIYREYAAAHAGYSSAASVMLLVIALLASVVMTLRARARK
ncbi:MAG: sugar ABC transporter permease [Bifidobacteriaceae bacterium]|jgi:ABC-type sugar transport system permease subunit|nr:sugar ABC transporter permease [Bifidobacteriaceae bacterium]